MATQQYECTHHGQFEAHMPPNRSIPSMWMCPKGPHMGFWRPSAVYFIVQGGTGAQRNPR